MKKTWVRPKGSIENFVPNEYINSCMEISLQCAIPGWSKSYVGDGDRTATDDRGMWHGSCGDASTTFVASLSASGYEYRDGKVDKNRTITNVKLGSSISDLGQYTKFSSKLTVSTPLDSARAGNYYATWDSTDGNGTYHHYGLAVVKAIDTTHPNHS